MTLDQLIVEAMKIWQAAYLDGVLTHQKDVLVTCDGETRKLEQISFSRERGQAKIVLWSSDDECGVHNA